MKLAAINKNLRAKLSPGIAHDLELQTYGRQLCWGGVAYFYCEFFRHLEWDPLDHLVLILRSLFLLNKNYTLCKYAERLHF